MAPPEQECGIPAANGSLMEHKGGIFIDAVVPSFPLKGVDVLLPIGLGNENESSEQKSAELTVSMKRKREDEVEEEREGGGADGAIGPEADDPLFVTKPRRRQRTVERKRESGVVKVVKKKTKKNGDDEKDDDGDYQEQKDPEGMARRYQLQILREAQKRNTIVYLETGCGKTLIAVLRLRWLAHRLRMPDQKRIAVFLVPTVNLVRQQSCVIDCHTDLKFGEYVGHMGVDTWKPEKWQEEIAKHEVLVMTPQILLDLLTHAILKLDIVEILIFDECHHATRKHPYCKIMDKYRETPVDSRPQIFGMTASPVNSRGVRSGADADRQLAALEQKLDSKVYAVKDRSELESFVPTPTTIGREYETSTFSTEEYKSKLRTIAEKYQVYKGEGDSGEKFKDYEEVGKKCHKAVNKLNNALVYCLDKLGLSCARKAAKLLMKVNLAELPVEVDADVMAVLKAAKDSFLKDASDFLQSGIDIPEDAQMDLSERVSAGLLTPKVRSLVEVLMKYRDVQEVRCIVFVDRVVASVVLASLITELECLSFLRTKFLAGLNSSLDKVNRKFQQAAIEEFRAGQTNVLVATNVAEEGLDVQGCHSVIRFDPCTSVRSHIQSRGRARRPGSDYIVLMERGNEREKLEFDEIVQSEIKMTEKALDRLTDLDDSIAPPVPSEKESFRVESTGAIMTTDLSINFIHRFCAKLPGDKYYTPRPEFTFSQTTGAMQVAVLRLPPNSPVHELTGPPRRSQLLAKQAVSLQACSLLHSMGAVSDHLLPVIDVEKVDELDKMNLGTTKNRGAGTTKQKELHNTIRTSTLKGSWGEQGKGATLHAYWLTFTSEDENFYGSFAFLVETELDDDVARLEVELVLKLGKLATAKFRPAGAVDLTADQVRDAKQFQELLFNGMFSKLLTRASNQPALESARKALKVPCPEELWDSTRMYLLLPARRAHHNVANSPATHLEIDWKSTSETATAARKFRELYSSDEGHDDAAAQSSESTSSSTSVGPGILEMAFGARVKLADVKDCVALTVHTGMIYVVTKVHEIDATAPFPECKQDEKKKNEKKKGEKKKDEEEKDEKKKDEEKKDEEKQDEDREPTYATYCDYFEQKHKRVLKYPNQPLLQAKQTHRARNLLARNSVCGSGKKKSKGKVEEEEPCCAEIPPELCIVLGLPAGVVRSAYLIPSVMHRMEAALTASDLRRVIREEMPKCPVIPISTMVEALTTLRCLEEFSLEGLELLGDSFLKYAQSRYLFLEYQDKHEGQLSARRCREICNAKLHALAVDRRLPEYIRDEVFDPSCWVPPGMLCPKMLLCRCNLESLWQCGTDRCGPNEEKKKIDGAQDSTMNPKAAKVVKIGKSCANGHRWLCSKNISDVVEALIGAYLVEGDASGALNFMTWAGFLVEVDESKIEKARTVSEVDHNAIPVGADLERLESILNYTFTNKFLLVEALTHASHLELKRGLCYQRLEFLGDAVLDLLITKHLFLSHPGLTPGRLTDLRSAAVNNDCFARVSVKHKFNKYLRHSSGFLLKQVEEFVKACNESTQKWKDCCYGWDGVKGPKVLGDLVESIAGAVLVDSGFNLEKVWRVMEPLLSPIVTPDKVPLHPARELQELCHLTDSMKMILQTDKDEKNTASIVTVEIGNVHKFSVTSSHVQKRAAQKDAAQRMLALLEERGLWHPCKVSKLGKCDPLRLTGPPVTTQQDSASQSHKRKLDDIHPGVDTEADSNGVQVVPASRKLKVGHTSLQEVISLIPGSETLGVEALCTDNQMISCTTANLRTTEHKELDAEGHAITVPAS